MMGDADREVYFEFTAIGAAVKVVAIDGQTGLEVTVMGPAGAPRADLQRLAMQKLKARLAKGPERPSAD
jgi:enamine deaminase RidA (YjgF/YER057c/UK114 family)